MGGSDAYAAAHHIDAYCGDPPVDVVPPVVAPTVPPVVDIDPVVVPLVPVVIPVFIEPSMLPVVFIGVDPVFVPPRRERFDRVVPVVVVPFMVELTLPDVVEGGLMPVVVLPVVVLPVVGP